MSAKYKGEWHAYRPQALCFHKVEQIMEGVRMQRAPFFQFTKDLNKTLKWEKFVNQLVSTSSLFDMGIKMDRKKDSTHIYIEL